MFFNICIILGLFLYNSAFAEDLEQAKAEGYKEALEESANENQQPDNSLPDPKPLLPPAGQIPQNIISLGEGDYFSKFVFIADKTSRTISIWQNENHHTELVAAYPFDMGKKPGDKTILGDLKTPEGIYFFNGTYTKNQLDYNEYGLRAFTLNYPNFFDQIEKKTGYGIWLHAIPPTKSLKRGSRGCLVVRNEAIEKVKQYVDLNKTHVIVEDKIDYGPQENILKNKKDFFKWLEQWKISWEGKQISNYMNFYHDLFKTNKMNKLQWQEYKNNLNEKYNYINVKLYSPIVFQHKDEIIVRFLQRYESDLNSDFGEKTLYVKKEAGQFKIIGEEWAPLSNNDMVATFESTKCAIPGC